MKRGTVTSHRMTGWKNEKFMSNKKNVILKIKLCKIKR